MNPSIPLLALFATVAFVDEDEVTGGPCLVDTPGRIKGAADVEPAVDQPAGDGGQPIGVADDLVWFQPRVVPPAVWHLASDPEPKAGL